MDAKILVLLLIVVGTGGWYCYVGIGVLIVAMLKNARNKKEVEQ